MDKLIILELVMQSMKLDLLCIQETHTQENDHYITDNGYLVILSGTSDDKHAGVGFIVSPEL